MVATFRSGKRGSLRVSFPEDNPKFGLGKDRYGEPAPWPPVQFENGIFRTESDKLAKMLREHPGYKDDPKQGRLFWEEDVAVERMLQGTVEKTVTAPKDGVNKADLQDLDTLSELSVSLAAPTMKKAGTAYDRIAKRFDAQGLAGFEEANSPRQGKSLINDLLDLLEQNQLWSENEGKGNS